MTRTIQLSAQNHDTSDELSRKRLAGLAGLQYGGDRDVYDVAGYPTDLDFDHYWDRYQRQHIARRVVDMPARATWRHTPTVVEDPDSEEESEFDRAFRQLAQNVQLWHKLERVDRLAGVGEFAVLMIGQRADDDDLAGEMEQMQGPEDVIYASPYHQGDTDIEDWITEHRSERHGLPGSYDITISSNVPGFPESNEIVHWSRVLHVADGLLDDEVHGMPRLHGVFNLFIDLEKETAATGESYWQLADQILQLSVDPEAPPEAIDLDDLESDMLDLVHNLRRHFLGQGIELDYLGGDTPDPSDAADLVMTLIASASGIPKGILFGTERGDVADRQDQREWAGRISQRQTWFAEPMVLRPLTDRLIEYGALPEPADGYAVQWPSIIEMTEEERAEINKSRAQAAKALAPVGGSPIEAGVARIDEDGMVQLVATDAE